MTEVHTDRKQVLFIHGGGEDGYGADTALAASLQKELGTAYHVRYPRMPGEDTPDFGWGGQIAREIAAVKGEVILAGHSLGASMLLKYLSENRVHQHIGGLFLLATPYWSGDEDWHKGLKVRDDVSDTLPADVPIFLYHSRDDEEVNFADLALYARMLPQATIREVASGGHQFGDDLTQVARDIKSLSGS
jgi:uncharacterized protein